MADDFDIDIYGDDAAQDYQESSLQGGDVKQEDATAMHTDSHYDEPSNTIAETKPETTDEGIKEEISHSGAANGGLHHEHGTQQISSTGGSANDQIEPPKQAPRQQGMKRKQGDDDERPTDPGATAALMINDLNWWISEEDIRGWANQSGCEDELLEVTFNEHKVNGKSKGQVYVHLQTPQAATALKHQLESFYQDQTHAKKPSAIYNAPHVNPFKTLPKDVPARDKSRGDRSTSVNYGGNQGGGGGGGNFGNRYNNNNRGGFNNRGNAGFQNNRNFSGPAGGNIGNNMGGNMGGFGGPAPMTNFGGGPMGGMNNFGGGFNRGGMMGGNMRGGMNNRGTRGGMGGMGSIGGGMNMPMGGNMMGMGMGMGGMGMGGNMGMMGGMGGPAFGGNQPHFNPAFFNQNQGGGDGNWNPHPAKRPRPE